MRLLISVIGLLILAPTAQAQVGAFQTNCGLGGGASDGSHQFVVTCPGRAWSPDGRFAVVQRAYREKQSPIELQDSAGRTLAHLPTLSDEMPFSVYWAPNSRSFFVNHHVGSFMSVLRVFEIVGRRPVERPALTDAAVRVATRHYPCLPADMVLPRGTRWTRDSRRIVLVTLAPTRACGEYGRAPGDWKPLWMIGDVPDGRIDPASIRVDHGDEGLTIPRGGIYSRP